MASQFIDLDLAKFSNISNTLALERMEIGSDAAVLQIDDACKRLVEKRTDRSNWEVSRLGLRFMSAASLISFVTIITNC